MIPTLDTNNKAEMLGFLTDAFKGQPNIEGILTSLASSIQQLEDTSFDYLTKILLTNAQGDVLDKYGAIAGVNRNGLSDPEFKIIVLAKFKANRSGGRAEDVIGIATLILSSFTYDEYYPAGFAVVSLNVLHPLQILQLIGLAKEAGVKGNFLYSYTWPAVTNLVFGSSIGSVSGTAGFMDAISGAHPNVMISSQEFHR